MSRIRRLEDEGQVNEAMALARDAAASMPAAYDWGAELVRLENEGKLARPYREGVEALGEGDYEDAQRLLSWVSGKNPRYREVSRYLYWATSGRDPDTAPSGEDEAPPPSLLSSGTSPLASPLAWGLAVLFGVVGFGLGWTLKPSGDPPPAVAAAAPEAPPEVAAEEAAPAPAAAPAAAPAEAAPPLAAAPAPAASADASASRAAPRASSSSSRTSTDPSVSDVENPSLMSEADQLAINCQNGSAAACFKVGDSYYFGRGIARDISAAVRFYTKACDGGEPRGCYNAGDMVEKGESVPKDKQKAKSLFDRGCKMGDSQSCSRKEFLELETAEVP